MAQDQYPTNNVSVTGMEQEMPDDVRLIINWARILQLGLEHQFYALFGGEVTLIVCAILTVLTAFRYVRHAKFHPNLRLLFCNVMVAYFVLAPSRLLGMLLPILHWQVGGKR